MTSSFFRTACFQTYLSWEMLSNSALFSGLVCMRKLTVRTNWPTVAEKPERKALKGCNKSRSSAKRQFLDFTHIEQWNPIHQQESKDRMFSTSPQEHPENSKTTYKISSNNTINKLQHSHGNQEDQESVQQFHALRRLVDVLVPHSRADLLQVCGIAY
jgi:hypothetical protein